MPDESAKNKMEKAAKAFNSIVTLKNLNATSFLLGMKQISTDNNYEKDFYSYMQQLACRRSKEIGISSTNLVFDVKAGSDVLMKIIDMASVLDNKSGVRNLNNYLNNILEKSEMNPLLAYSIGHNLANHFTKLSNIKGEELKKNNSAISNTEKFLENIIKSKKVIDCINGNEIKESKSYLERISNSKNNKELYCRT